MGWRVGVTGVAAHRPLGDAPAETGRVEFELRSEH